jgi:hypothetical protein
LKLWLVIYIAHQVIFSQVQPNDMGKCEQNIVRAHALLESINPAVSINIAPQYRKHIEPEQTMFCMWNEKDPASNGRK